MKRAFWAAWFGLFCLAAWGQVGGQAGQSNGLGVLRNAQYVYVTSYDGPQFSQELLEEDRAGITATQKALEQSGQFIVVYKPREADMIVVVQSRPSEDVLAVYDRNAWPTGNWLWRASKKGGLSDPDVPLVRQLEAALERASSDSGR
jgi:hypothetical protein